MEQSLPLSPEQARLLTDRIVTTPGGRWTRIAEGHARGVAEALGYPTWEAYCEAEFGPERFRIPGAQRYEVLSELKDAGMSFEDVEMAVIPQNRARERYASPPAPLPVPAPLTDEADPENGDGQAGGVEYQLGFTPAELELIGALLEVDDEEFNRVLTAGHHRHDLSPAFVREQCRLIIQGRETLARNLDRALRSIERAHDLVHRSLQGEPEPGVPELLRLLEDETWDLIDTIDRLNVHLDNGTDEA